MWPSSPARAWARRASMVSSIPDSFRARRVLARAPVSIVVGMAAAAAARALRAVMTLPRFREPAACSGDDVAVGGEQGVGAVQERGRSAVPGRAGHRRPLGAGGQDALDGPVGRVTGGGGFRAGGLEPAGLVLVGQVQHALRGAEPVERVVFQQPADQRLARRADLGGFLPAPRRGAHVERDLLRRVVGQVGLLALRPCGHGSSPGPRRRTAAPSWRSTGHPGSGRCASTAPSTSVRPTLTWMSGPTLHRDQSASTNGDRRQRRQARPSRPRRTPRPGRRRPAAGRPAARPPRCTTARPRPASAPAGELPAPPERVPDIRHRPLDLRLIPRFPGPGRVDQAAVMRGELGIRPVDLRVIQVRPVDPGLQVVGHQPRGHPAEEPERRHVALGPRVLVHR